MFGWMFANLTPVFFILCAAGVGLVVLLCRLMVLKKQLMFSVFAIIFFGVIFLIMLIVIYDKEDLTYVSLRRVDIVREEAIPLITPNRFVSVREYHGRWVYELHQEGKEPVELEYVRDQTTTRSYFVERKYSDSFGRSSIGFGGSGVEYIFYENPIEGIGD
ncbi:MAG: hypothetical protein ACLFUO_06505 [Candidatus Woesearchaeota archaeon]